MSSGILRNNKLVILAIACIMVAVFVGSLSFLKNVYQTENYYVLNQSVSARSQISPDMLVQVTTSKGTAPSNALAPADVQSGLVFSRIALYENDIVTRSNTSGLDDIAVGIPDNWVVTSFSVRADNAVGGRITRGVYFDLMVSTRDGSFYPFVNMLTLDTSTSLNSASGAGAVNTDEAKSGQTSVYYVGATPEDAAILQTIMQQHGNNVRLVLSPRSNAYEAPDMTRYEGLFTFDADTFSSINGGEGTDNSFDPKAVKRESDGRPINPPWEQ